MNGNEEQELKQEMNQRSEPDSFEVAIGTAAKGIGLKLKCYYNATNYEESELKVKNTLKIKDFLMSKGIIV
jgi:hypothetical protein